MAWDVGAGEWRYVVWALRESVVFRLTRERYQRQCVLIRSTTPQPAPEFLAVERTAGRAHQIRRKERYT
jgi:hypothetical protein